MNNSIPLIIQMGALPLNFQGTPQQFADAIAERLSIVTQQALALFAAGSTEPAFNVGPWLDQSSSIGIWKGFDFVTGRYQPLPLADVSLRYILSNTPPNPTVFQLWVKLSNAGKGQGAYVFYNGAWHDIYEDVINTITAAINAVLPTAGPAGEVLTSNGPGVAPVWGRDVYPGMIVDYAGATAPNARFYICDGAEKLIAGDQQLFAAIGAVFGGDGISTFNLPDLRGRGRAGLGTADANGATPTSLGQKKGEETHLLTVGELAKHHHKFVAAGLTGSGAAQAGANSDIRSPTDFTTDDEGLDTPHNTLGPILGLNALIYRY
jgi:microcystin-dependent protein